MTAMARQGRRPRWTRAQRERVLELAAQGASQRAIAEAVFGNARLRGRVERILAAEAAASNGPDLPRITTAQRPSGEPFAAESDLETLSRARLALGTALRDGGEQRAILEPKDAGLLVIVMHLLQRRSSILIRDWGSGGRWPEDSQLPATPRLASRLAHLAANGLVSLARDESAGVRVGYGPRTREIAKK